MPHDIWLSAAFGALSTNGRALLLELAGMENGKNNGSLWLSIRDATERLGFSDARPAMQAFDEVQATGFVTMAKDAHFWVKAADTSRARCWRLTWLPWPECPTKSRRIATNEWRDYQPAQTPGGKRVERRQRALARYRKNLAANRLPVVESTTIEAQMPNDHPLTVVESTTGFPETNVNPPFSVVVDSTAHTAVTMGRGSLGWWATDLEALIAGQILLLFVVTQNRPHLARVA